MVGEIWQCLIGNILAAVLHTIGCARTIFEIDTIYTGSLTEERSPPIYFWPNFLYMYRDKVYSNEHSPWFKIHMASAVYLGGRGSGREGVRSTASSTMHIGGKELCHTF